ncbi:MAG: phosphate uptake regulator PhoU [Nitrosopumilaceae archaeon]|nr:phosphate uptake regulator PhoU [Nitrosopumilaceae archaeon]NIU00807.1 phosphate uptake regulator PhoU [Nitrosopumilaceae archaeon]NIU87260.1 phosphate uptake regulator PhoU [Nitrosopumilaceae archaeon]NIV65788.1 phosphate uptake regulator PhoU [Nitrosopumilaceae archaeon]NIX61409.1 phosphate uptake regulator PhoU [Nitrosopumilaceae archaeon]
MPKFVRRLQRIGSSILVSLPKDWILENHLEKNIEVELETSPDSVLITTNKGRRPLKEVIISYPLPKEENIVADITGAYLLGYDMIKIESKFNIPIRDRDNIRNSMRRLVGMEIVEEDASTITMQFLLDTASLNPQKILKRTSTIVLGMFNDVYTSLISKDKSNLQTLPSRDVEVNRQYFLLVRLVRSIMIDPRLSKTFHLENIDVLDYRLASNLLEGSADTIVELAEILYSKSIPEQDLKKIYDVAKDFELMEQKAIDAFIKNDRRLAIDAISLHKKNQTRITSLMSTIRNKTQIPIDFLDVVYMFDRVEKSWADVADLIKPLYD